MAAFFAGGAVLSADAWQRAWHPPLWTAFEALARTQRLDAEHAGRRLPLDEEAFAVVQGQASLRRRAEPERRLAERGGGRAGRARAGGEGLGAQPRAASSSPSSDLWQPSGSTTGAPDAACGCRCSCAGRRAISIPASPIRSGRSRGVGRARRHGEERRAGRRPRARQPLDEAMGRRRGRFSRRAIADAVGRWSPQSAAIVAAIVIGDRAGLDQDVQRRLQEAGTYHVIAISGGNIAILAGLLLGAFRVAGLAGPRGDAVGDRRAARVRAPGRRRRLGRSRHADGGRLFRRAGARSAQPAAERAGGRRGGARRRATRCRSPTLRFS